MEKTEGWLWLSNSPKWHYFRKPDDAKGMIRSLCGRWGAVSLEDAEQGNDGSIDNCKACKDKRAKEKAKAAALTV